MSSIFHHRKSYRSFEVLSSQRKQISSRSNRENAGGYKSFVLKALWLTLALIAWNSASSFRDSILQQHARRSYSWQTQHFQPPPKGQLCNNYDGILFISQNHDGAGTGTFFFQAIVDQILFAEAHNLYPFIWMNNHLEDYNPCFDPIVHGNAPNASYTHLSGTIENVRRILPLKCRKEPARLSLPWFGRKQEREIQLLGNGIWQSYFVPYEIPFDDASCKDKPVFELSFEQVFPGLHYCWDGAIRGWPFTRLPNRLKPEGQGLSIKAWLTDHRMRGAYAVHKHIQLQPWLQTKVDEINPAKHGTCLAVHIRMTDKAGGRKKEGVETYLPYIEEFVQRSKRKTNIIYLATDDSRVIDDLLSASSNLQRSMFMMQPNVLQSDSDVATFEKFKDTRHRVNTETLIEIYALSKCSYIVHGYSAVSESAVYLNPPLDANSVNVDDPAVMGAEAFGALVERTLVQ